MGRVPEADTHSSLLVRIRNPQDRASWKDFVATYVPIIYRYLKQRGLQEADISDVSQEVLADVARCIANFEYQPERGRFRDWLGLLTRRKMIRFWERTKKLEASPADSQLGESDIDGEWNEAFHSHLLRLAMEKSKPFFEPNTWEAFRRIWVEGESAATVSAELKLPIEAVYNAKSRVLKRLEAEVLLLADDCAWLQKQ